MEYFETLTIGKGITHGLLLIIGLIALFSSFVITQQKTSKILTMFGKYYGCTQPGLQMKLPWPFVVQQDWISLNIQELKGDVTIKSSDNAFLTVPWALQYRVLEDKIKEAYYELDNPEEQMQSYILNTLRGEASNLTMEQLFKSNESFETAAHQTLREKFSKYGYEIVNVLIDDPQPSTDLKQAFDRVISSKREKEAAENIAAAVRIKMVGEAEAEGESLKIKAEAFKVFRAKIAEGNSEAIQKFLEGIEDGQLNSKDVLEFFAGVDLRDTIRDASKGNGHMVIIPVDFKNNITIPVQS